MRNLLMLSIGLVAVLLPHTTRSIVGPGGNTVGTAEPIVVMPWSDKTTWARPSLVKKKTHVDVGSFRKALPKDMCAGFEFPPATVSVWGCGEGDSIRSTMMFSVNREKQL